MKTLNKNNKISMIVLLIFLFCMILVVFSSCSSPKQNYSTLIKEQAFVDDVNSFRGAVSVKAVYDTDSSYIFVVHTNDSIFVYNTEKTKVTKGFYNHAAWYNTLK